MKTKKSYLIVEGKNDVIVISNLCREHKIANDIFSIEKSDSKENAIMQFDISINELATRTKTVGIVVDADTNMGSTWQKIRTKIEGTNQYNNIPKKPGNDGLILSPISPSYPRIGIWIMPDNSTNGMLEDFVVLLANENDALMQEAENILKSLESRNINEYKPVHRSKAKIHTYLAWKDEPGKPMGQAITSHILNPKTQAAGLFIQWIKDLFEI